MESDTMNGKPRSRRGSLTPYELSMNLRTLGFSTWKDLEPTDHINDEEYVRKKLNESLFKKLQEFGGSHSNDVSGNSTPNPQRQSNSVRRRRRSSVAIIDETPNIKTTTNTPVRSTSVRRNSVMQDQRSVHDAYHSLLAEYERRKLQRKKKSEERRNSNVGKGKDIKEVSDKVSALSIEENK